MKTRIIHSILRLFAHIPDKLVPPCLQNYLATKADQVISEKKKEIVRMRWKQVQLEQQLASLRAKQNTNNEMKKDGC